jgi:succinate-semialdehyde dehydrogenase
MECMLTKLGPAASRSRLGTRGLSSLGLGADVDALVKDKAYVNGAWIGAASNKTFQVTNPMNSKVLSSIPDMNAGDVSLAVDAANDAFQTWRGTTAKYRSDLLRKWFNLCVAHQEGLAKLLTAEQGKPLAEARGELVYGSSYIEWFSEECRRINGEIAQSPAASKEMMFIRQPIGVVGMITPWNFPNAMITRKVAAALAAGCTCVVKPAEDTPLSALALGALAEEAGIPPGVVNIITCSREHTAEVGQLLCESPKVAGISFTGSTKVGKILYRQSASTIKRLGLELGGNASFIVFDSANLDLAVQGCMASKFRNAGQTCVSTNRVLVQESVLEEFVIKLRAAMDSLVLGDGLTDGVSQGPIINKSQFDKICEMVTDARSQGAELVVGGEPCSQTGQLFYKPTILTNVTECMSLYQEEIFGPVVSIKTFKTEEEALALANDSRVGLASYFYSENISQCFRVAKKLETGMVGINEGAISAAEAAFGGIKESGLGREGSSHGLDEYTNIKYMCFGNL